MSRWKPNLNHGFDFLIIILSLWQYFDKIKKDIYFLLLKRYFEIRKITNIKLWRFKTIIYLKYKFKKVIHYAS
jgi:hypothetical protein